MTHDGRFTLSFYAHFFVIRQRNGRKKTNRGARIGIVQTRPSGPLFQPRFQDEVGDIAKLNETPDYP